MAAGTQRHSRPQPAAQRDVLVDDHPTHVLLGPVVPGDPAPLEVRADQYLLDDVLGGTRVAAQHRAEAQQRRQPLRDELLEVGRQSSLPWVVACLPLPTQLGPDLLSPPPETPGSSRRRPAASGQP
jgi:hypothetical protein